MPRTKTLRDITAQGRRISNLSFQLENRAFSQGGFNADWRRTRERRNQMYSTIGRYATNMAAVRRARGTRSNAPYTRNVYAAQNRTAAIRNYDQEQSNFRSQSKGNNNG